VLRIFIVLKYPLPSALYNPHAGQMASTLDTNPQTTTYQPYFYITNISASETVHCTVLVVRYSSIMQTDDRDQSQTRFSYLFRQEVQDLKRNRVRKESKTAGLK
jgi:hypothetical protein